MVKRWYADFKHGRTDTNDAEWSSCPNSAVVLEDSKKLHRLVLADHKLKLHEIAEELMSEGRVFTILQEPLSMRKLCSKWVPCLLTVDQKQLVDDSECFCNVTMDKTWIHHFTPESNRQSAEWTATDESCPKRPKIQTSVGKVLASVFGICKVFCSLITLTKEEPSIVNIIQHYWHVLRKKVSKNIHKEEKSSLSPRKCTMLWVDRNDGITTWIVFRTASAPTLFSRPGPQWL